MDARMTKDDLRNAWFKLHRKHKEERIALMKEALRACNGNRSKAADLIGTYRRTLQRYVGDYDIKVPPGGDQE